MKAFVGLMKILTTLVSLSLVVLLAFAILPIASGGINTGDPTSLNAEVQGSDLKVSGEITLISSLNEDVENVRLHIYCKSETGNIEILDQTQTLTAGSTTTIPISASVPIAEALIHTLNYNAEKTTPGIVLPVTIGISGTYFHSMLGFDFELDYNLQVSSTGTLDINKTEDADGNVTAVNVTVEDFVDSDLIASMVPEGSRTASVSVGGSQVNLNLDRIGGRITVGISSADNEVLKTVLDEMFQKAEQGETISFVYDGQTVSMDTESLEGLVNVMKGLVDTAAAMGAI